MRRDDSEYQHLLQTIYAHFRNESTTIQQCIAWVIKNRTEYNRPEWGGYTIEGVCRTFPCWKRGRVNVKMLDRAAQASIENWLPTVFDISDPTRRAVMYHNPVLKTSHRKPVPSPDKYTLSIKIGFYNFYKIREV